MELRTAYWDDPEARGAFKDFIRDIHGLDFTAWEQAGYWDDAYTPFSYFEDGRVVASVCIYLLDAVINGEATHVVQISGVGTEPRYRRRGLNRKLTDIGLERVAGKYRGLFLFADTEAIPFYERCGFTPLAEYVEIVAAPSDARQDGAVKLDCTDETDLARIYDLARRRAPVSTRFAVLNAKLVMFHVLYRLQEHSWAIPDLDCIVFCRRAGGRLEIYDILGERIPAFGELYPYIASPEDEAIRFHFHADELGLEGTVLRREQLPGNNCYTRGSFPVARPVFPYTSRA